MYPKIRPLAPMWIELPGASSQTPSPPSTITSNDTPTNVPTPRSITRKPSVRNGTVLAL